MTPQQEFAASVISNIVAILLLLLSWKKKNLARLLFSALFIWAAVVNWNTAHSNPNAYLDYGRYAIPLYKRIIACAFSEHITLYISCIAAGQLLIGLWL